MNNRQWNKYERDMRKLVMLLRQDNIRNTIVDCKDQNYMIMFDIADKLESYLPKQNLFK